MMGPSQPFVDQLVLWTSMSIKGRIPRAGGTSALRVPSNSTRVSVILSEATLA